MSELIDNCPNGFCAEGLCSCAKKEDPQAKRFPELNELGAQQAEEIFVKFKDRLKKIANETLGELYCDVAIHIEGDSWINFRNEFFEIYKGYKKSPFVGMDAKNIREEILKNHKEEIIADINQDNLDEIKRLKDHIEWLGKFRS